MSFRFVGRQHELDVLQQAYQRRHSTFFPIYGRRRVGKSELILHFLRNKPALYFVGKKSPATDQIREFLQIAADALDEPLLTKEAGDWREALARVVDRWQGPKKLVLVLDEFQWSAKQSPELPSVLQELWDRHWQHSGKLMLILCGSYIGFMEREVLGSRSPLYGRRTGQILLRPFNFIEAGQFHPSLSAADKARFYFVCGGIPYYLRQFSERLSIEQNIATHFLEETAALNQEPEFLLREELEEQSRYNAILAAISAGSSTHSEIALQAGLDPRALAKYLRNLLGLQYISKRYPLSGKKEPARRVRYYVADPLLRFWFRFIYPSQSSLRLLGPKQGLQQIVRPGLEAFWGLCFEELCKEALPLLYRKEEVTAPFQIGSYWDRTVQIDVVGYREDSRTDLGECKWGAAGPLPALVRQLKRKADFFPNERGATLGMRAFTRQPLKTADRFPEVHFHDLEELYRL